MYPLIFMGGCAAPVVSGESVLGVDVPAEIIEGEAGDRLGASVAADGERWMAAAPGAGVTWVDGQPMDARSAWVGWWEGREVLVNPEGTVTVDGEARWTVEGAHAWAIGDAGVLAATSEALVFVDRERVIAVAGVESVAWGTGRALANVCREGCEARAWTEDGEPLGAWAAAGEGGAVGEWDGVAWAGDPAWEDPEGAGEVCSEVGACVVGAPGDHVGAAIGGGYTAGTFNSRIVPPRARIVPLGEGPTYCMEEGAELQEIVLAGADQLVIGAPYYPAHGEPSGAVVRVP